MAAASARNIDVVVVELGLRFPARADNCPIRKLPSAAVSSWDPDVQLSHRRSNGVYFQVLLPFV